MRLFIPRALLLSSLALLSACSVAGQGAAPPQTITSPQASEDATIQQALDNAPEVTGGHYVFKKMPIQPDAKGPALLMNFVANGPNQGGVPCIGCVLGASSGDTIGMTGPSSYVFKNTYWQYEISYTDLSYTGKCKLSWAITSGKKTIDSFSVSINLTSAGGFVLYAVSRARPKYSGMATVTGKYTCGKDSASQKAPIEFQ